MTFEQFKGCQMSKDEDEVVYTFDLEGGGNIEIEQSLDLTRVIVYSGDATIILPLIEAEVLEMVTGLSLALESAGLETALMQVLTRQRTVLLKYETALKRIASCKSHAPGDVVDIAIKALEPENDQNNL